VARIAPTGLTSGPQAPRKEREQGAVAPESTSEGRGGRRSGRPEQAEPASEGEDEPETGEGRVVSPRAFSTAEAFSHREFDRMTAGELRDAERLIDLLRPRLETRLTRRYEHHPHGRRLAPRAMFRRNLATGGDLVEWVWRRRVRRPRTIVVLCDVSGSMERHARLLLRFVQALTRASGVRTESFVFGTRLTRITHELRGRDPDLAIRRVSETVSDWSGGTRIGESLRAFNLRWARRVLRTSGVVIVVSDGWDRGDPALVGAETARLQRNCHRLIWLNPLAGADGYEPLAAGMSAAYPSVDDFLRSTNWPRSSAWARCWAGWASVPRAGRRGTDPDGLRVEAGGSGRRSITAVARASSGRRRGRAARPSIRRRPGRWPGEGRGGIVRELLDQVRAWQAEGAELGRAVVVRTFGSAPRPEGATLVATADGRLAGPSRAAAWKGRVRGDPARRADGVSGSSATASATSRPGTSAAPAAGRSTCWSSRCPARGGRGSRRTGGVAVVVALPATRRRRPSGRTPPGRRGSAPAFTIAEDGSLAGSTGSPAADAALAGWPATSWPGAAPRPRRRRPPVVPRGLPDRAASRHRGRRQVAMPLSRIARELGYATVVVGRAGGLRHEGALPDVDALVVGWPDEVAEEIGLGPADAVAVLTHDVKFDEPAIVEALRRGCRYVGRSGRGRRRPTAGPPPGGGRGGGRPRPAPRPDRAASAAGPRPRRPSPSWPRSWPSGTEAPPPRCRRWRGRADGDDRVAGGCAGPGRRMGMRFGGGKVRAQLEGRPSWPTCCRWPGRAGIERLVLVVGRDAGRHPLRAPGLGPEALGGVLVAVTRIPSAAWPRRCASAWLPPRPRRSPPRSWSSWATSRGSARR